MWEEDKLLMRNEKRNANEQNMLNVSLPKKKKKNALYIKRKEFR